MAAIEISGLCKSFGPVAAVQDVTLTIQNGEFVVLVGPSGCGKSTLLRLIAGLEMTSAGAIVIDGNDVTDLPAKARDIAMVFQSYALYPHMTVAENMGFSLRVRRVDTKTIDQRVRAAATILGLTEYLRRKPAQLSGGQRQRVAMGRAIVRDPKVFLFDEPLSNLDAQLRVSMRSEIKALHQRLKTTTIYVTHDQIEAMSMADRIVVLRDGHIEQVGTPLEVYDRPASVFVGGFIGSPAMNFLPARLQREKGTALMRTNGGTLISVPHMLEAEDEQEILIGIRPEHLTVSSWGTLKGKVAQVEPLGAQVLIVCDLDGLKVLALQNERVLPEVGAPIHLEVGRKAVHVFDAGSGKRLEMVH
jgi:multiple sugar transport system ATP-binding protein